MKIEDDDIIMDDGTKYSANRGVIGLSPSGNIFEGWDGGICNWDYDEDGSLPPHHRKEIAEYMIQAWSRVRDEQKEQP